MDDEEFNKKYPALAARRLKVLKAEIVEKKEEIPKRSTYGELVEKLSKERRAQEAKRKREYYEKNRERVNARKRDRKKSDPAYREKERLRSKRKYEANKAEYNARKTEWSRKNKARFRASWNAWYERVKHSKRGQQLESRIRNRPLYGLAGALRDFERGTIGVDELNRLYDVALARVNDVGRRGRKEKQG